MGLDNDNENENPTFEDVFSVQLSYVLSQFLSISDSLTKFSLLNRSFNQVSN